MRKYKSTTRAIEQTQAHRRERKGCKPGQPKLYSTDDYRKTLELWALGENLNEMSHKYDFAPNISMIYDEVNKNNEIAELYEICARKRAQTFFEKIPQEAQNAENDTLIDYARGPNGEQVPIQRSNIAAVNRSALRIKAYAMIAERLDPERFTPIQRREITGKGGKDLAPSIQFNLLPNDAQPLSDAIPLLDAPQDCAKPEPEAIQDAVELPIVSSIPPGSHSGS